MNPFFLVFITSIFMATCQPKPSAEQSAPEGTAPFNVLVFSKTAGYYHESIPAGNEAILALGKKHGFKADTTKDASLFNEKKLATYRAVIFLNTTLDVLNDTQQVAFEKYIRSGGGFVGVHSAADTEYGWSWYGRLVGAYFKNHPAQQEAIIKVADKKHVSTKMLPNKWKRFDEWYNYKDISPDIHVLCQLDETTYEGGENGVFHPISWYHEYNGGRAWYTGLGHITKTYTEPLFLQHLWGGIKYAAGRQSR